MADTKISAATLTTPAATDLIPMERPSSAVARYASIASIVQAQAASLTEKGAVELATTAEAQAGASAALAVTPAGLRYVLDEPTFGYAPNAALNKIRIPPQGSSGYYFGITTATDTYYTHDDDQILFGYNPTGIRQDGSHSFYHKIEADYYTSAIAHQLECYYEYWSADLLHSSRPMQITVDLVAHTSIIEFRGTFGLYNDDKTIQVLEIPSNFNSLNMLKDIVFVSEDHGPTLMDRTLHAWYRITLDNGVIGVELWP